MRLALVIAVVAVLTACRKDPPAPAASSSVMTPVGPVPGPGEESAAGANPYANDLEAIEQGRILFRRFNCSGCHGDHAGGGMGPSLRDERWLYGGTDANVAASIAQGRAHGMPSWGPKLTTEQVWKLATYVKSLRTPREPDQPAGN